MSVGNRLGETTYLGTTTSAHDAADRLASVTPPGQSPMAYTYDANGNQLSAGTNTFSWDAANRLVSATTAGASETYTYAGDGRRLSVTSSGSTTAWLWDLGHGLPQLALERDGSGILRRSTYGLGRIATVADATTAYHHADGLGSLVDLTDAAGDSLAWAEYTPFGAERSGAMAPGAPDLPFGFTGEYADPTGLVHLRARQYDPTTGRFLSTDPVAPLLTDPYVGTYAYVRNMPTVAVDPSGRCPFCVLGAIGAAIGGVVGGATYALTAGDDFSVGGLVGAAAGGALVGATAAISGPLGGSAAASIGGGRAVAFGAAAAANFSAGTVGSAISQYAHSGQVSATELVGSGFFAAGLGAMGNAMWPLRGVYTLSNWRWAPRSISAFVGRGVNAQLAWRAAIFGGVGSTLQAAAISASHGK